MIFKKTNLLNTIFAFLIFITINSCNLFSGDCFESYDELDFEVEKNSSLNSIDESSVTKIAKKINIIINSKPINLDNGLRLNLSKNLLVGNAGINNFLSIYKIDETVSKVCYSREWLNKERPHMYDPDIETYHFGEKDYYRSRTDYSKDKDKVNCEIFYTIPTPNSYLRELSQTTMSLSRIPTKEKKTILIDSIKLEKLYGFNFISSNYINNQIGIYDVKYQYDKQGLITTENIGEGRMKFNYEYNFAITKGGFFKVEVKFSSNMGSVKNEDFVSIYFDEKINWIKIEYSDMIEQRSITY